jgi:nucleoid DNA-binding protein
MPRLSKDDVIRSLAETTGSSEIEVSQFFEALVSLATTEAHQGLVLPGLGHLIVESGPSRKGTNPFTGKTVEFKGPLQLSFNFDTATKKRLIKGRKNNSVKTESAEPRQLPKVRLVPDPSDLKRSELATSDNLTKLGGRPDWIQANLNPTCCGTAMVFQAQIDFSAISGAAWSSTGIFYTFYCGSCHEAQTFVQIT